MAQLSSEEYHRLEDEVERIVTLEGLELVHLEFKHESGTWVLRIYIDKPGGVGLDDCTGISREVGMMLEVENLISHSYNLEVSSPGLDRPLKKLEDFRRFAGKSVRIKLKPEHQGRKKFRGRIAGVDGEEILIENDVELQTHRLPLAEIHSARLEVEL
ncbi:MAG TPA: ribosome maturation factor RimP [Acidobacteriota bacterium]|nr:ribosome maturation factor RimP [Acidobacteriota bacterium]